MQNALRMRGAERVRDLDRQFDKRVRREGPTSQFVLQGAAFEPLHDDELLAVGFRSFPDVVNRADVRMIQRRGRPRLALKTADGVFVPRKLRRQEFQCDAAAEAEILGAKHHAHATATQVLDDAVARDSVPDSG